MRKIIIQDENVFLSTQKYRAQSWAKILGRIIVFTMISIVILLAVTPWRQTSHGVGRVMAFDPNDRIQQINAMVGGRVHKWYVRDGSKVNEGDPVVEIIDTDPNFVGRLKVERDAAYKKYLAAKSATETALLDFNRQKELFEQGLSARVKFEKAQIVYQKLLAEEAQGAASLAKSEVKYSRQQRQLITAPRDGTILRVLSGAHTVLVKEGDVLATFVPDTVKPAVELYISGNDLPLVQPGRKVRLQFEGWPAVQFSGWPSVAVGTFAGVVEIVDPSVSIDGKFRIIVLPGEGEEWPENTYLRQGARAFGWVLLDEVKLGYEFWRQLNGFPASVSVPDGDLKQKKELKNDKSKKEDDGEEEKSTSSFTISSDGEGEK